MEQSLLESEAEPHQARRDVEDNHDKHGDHDYGDGHGDHGGMRAGHEEMFRRRFFVSLYP